MARQFATAILLPGAPANTNEAATKGYVDGADAGKQPLDSDLTTIAALAPADGTFMRRTSGAWTGAAVTAADMPLVLGTPVASSLATTVTLDASAGSVCDISCTTATLAFGVPTNAANRQVLRVSVRRSTNAALTVNLNGSIRLSTGLATRALVVPASEVLIMALENVATFTPTAVWVLTAATFSAA